MPVRRLLAFTMLAAPMGWTAPGAAAETEPAQVGDTSFGLPGVERVPILSVPAPRLAIALDAGYGYTESQGSEGAHHRILGQLGVGIAPLASLELGARLLARHDRHPDDGLGTDTGTTLDLGLVARAGREVGSGVRLGGDLAATFPGAESLSDSLSNPALDGRFLFGWSDANRVHVAGFAGYRLDLTEGVAENRDRYRLGDRLALGASEFDAVLVGLGAVVPLGKVELLSEISGDVLIGSGAPPFSESPLRASLGARYLVVPRAELEVLGTASLSARPDLGPDSPLIPIEPRVSLVAGFRYRFWDGPEPVAQPIQPPPKPAPVVAPPKPEVQAPPPPIPTSTVRITVIDKTTGHPLSDAEAEIIVGGQARPLVFVTGSTFEVSEVPVGKAELVVRAERLKDWREPIEIRAGEPLEVQVAMIPAANSGQIRGLIRGFDGGALQAEVRIEPGGHAVVSGADGSFRVDVPPGKYTVEVTLPGYRTQKLNAQVGKDGVVVLNVDMIKGER